MAGYNYESYNANYGEASRLIKEGQYLFGGKNYQEALTSFKQASVLNDHDVRIYIGIGDCLYQLHKYDDACEAYDKAISYDKKRAKAYIGKGQCLHQLRRYEEACAEFNTAIFYAQDSKYESDRINAYRELCIASIALENYEEALDAYGEMKRLDPKRDVKLNKIPIKLRADYIEKRVQEGHQLFERRDYEKALNHFHSLMFFALHNERKNNFSELGTTSHNDYTKEETSYFNSKLGLIYVEKGHVEFALERSVDAQRSYAEAIDLGTTDLKCFLRMGEMFFARKDYDKAKHYYRLAINQIIDDFVVVFQIAETLFELKDYTFSLRTYQKALNLFESTKANEEKGANEKHLELLLRIGDLCNFLGEKTEAHNTYEKGLALINTPRMCFLAWDYVSLSRPASIWLALCKILCNYSISYDSRLKQALKQLEGCYPDLFDPLLISKEDMERNTRVLQEIFTRLPGYSREEILQMVAQGNERQIVHLLIHLAPANLSGLTTLVQNIMAKWHKPVSNKELIYRFYDILPNYSISPEQADLFLAQCLLSWGEYEHVQPILAPHIEKACPQRESLWCVLQALQHLEHSQDQYLTLLHRFIALFPNGKYSVKAYQYIGDLCVSKEDMERNTRVLQEIFTRLPGYSREEILQMMAQGNERQIVHLLIHLAPANLSGLTTLVQNIMAKWHKLVADKELIYRFYDVLPAYSISRENADLFLAQCLLSWEEYKQVQVVLLPHIEKAQPRRDSLWYSALALHHLNQDQATQLRLLRHFITLFPADTYVVDAYQRIGDLYWEYFRDGQSALEAYRKATRPDAPVPRYHSYLRGNWDPELFSILPDYRFPPVVVIDIECSYEPKTPLGSGVFEVAAVRIKGNTELDTYQAIIQREFVAAKVAGRQQEAKPLEIVVEELQTFIDNTARHNQPTIIVGHNLRAFDAPHLRVMGINIPEEQILDTLELARLLYPDSLHHHLSLLCSIHGIEAQGKYHEALTDARACARLLQALGDELMQRGERLLNGVRAFVSPNSAFDQAVLQPRNVPADPTIAWVLDPTPTLSVPLMHDRNTAASPKMQEALQSGVSVFVECNDPYGAYIRHLPPLQKSVVTVGTRVRLERMLSSASSRENLYVLPDTQTLLCPSRLRQAIEEQPDERSKLALFCLYQASHNHDAQTLYPLRFPASEKEFQQLRQTLIMACCSSEATHAPTCSALHAVEEAARECHVLLATHEAFLHWNEPLHGNLLVIDDINTLQMRFATHIAVQLDSQRLQQQSGEVFHLLNDVVAEYIAHSGDHIVAHERIHLGDLVPYLDLPDDGREYGPLSRLKKMGALGQEVAQVLRGFCHQVGQEEAPGLMHAYWLDIWFSHQPETDISIDRWQFNGLHCDIKDEFRTRFWIPYVQHILCGTAVSLGKQGTAFLKKFFGLPQNTRLLADKLPPRKVYIPPLPGEGRSDTVQLRPASFLGRRAWAESVGIFLFHLLQQPVDSPLSVTGRRSLMVSLHESAVAHALASAFSSHKMSTNCRILSTSLNWTTAKIAERLAAPMQPTIAFASPFVRENILDDQVDVEAIGPMRFLNQRDPLVAAHMRMFAQADSGIPMADYLLPQAMLELKTRLSSSAHAHIVLDSGLRAKVYRDEVWELFGNEIIDVDILPARNELSSTFASIFSAQLKLLGFNLQLAISAEELKQVLYAVWGLKEFRKSPLDQEAIIQETLTGNDQLVIAATGGGKSLCFQLPAILLAQESLPRVTLVISPLIALMMNQEDALRKHRVFAAVALNSALPPERRQAYLRGIEHGDYSIIYAAPEQIRTGQFQSALLKREIGLIAFDEAHCVSQWGHDFRTDYLVIRKWIEEVLCSGKRSFPILALTATARKGHSGTNPPELSTILDIIENLGLHKGNQLLKEHDVQITSPERAELSFKVLPVVVRCPNLGCVEKVSKGPSNSTVFCPSCGIVSLNKEGKKANEKYQFSNYVQDTKLKLLVSLLNEDGTEGLRQRWCPSNDTFHQRGLIYCTYIKIAIAVTDALCKRTDLQDLKVGLYHGKMKPEERSAVYQRFMSNELDIVVATNAFGMGIDVEHLGFVVHFDTPTTLENYYQEAGRAGRDSAFKDGGLKAHCILLYHESDLEKHRYLQQKKNISEQSMERVYDVLNKLRTSGRQELVISVADIALLASVGEDQVKTILYYLEHHTSINDQPVLKRSANAGNNKRQLRFERGYQQRMSEQSRELVEVLQTQLNEKNTVVIDTEELALSLQRQWSEIDNDIKNLLSRHILVEASYAYVQWYKNQGDALEAVDSLINDIRAFVYAVEGCGKIEQVDVHELYQRCQLKTPFNLFCEILHLLSQSRMKRLQLFSRFELAVKAAPHMYKLGMKFLPSSTFDALHSCLYMTINQLASEKISSNNEENSWCIVDKLKEVPDYTIEYPSLRSNEHTMDEHEKRDLLNVMLLLLNIFKVLKLHKNQDEYQERLHIMFKQKTISPEVLEDNIKVDLYKLRLMEYYSERKLDLMQKYAELSDEQYAQYFNNYFSGRTPFLEPFERSDQLTKEQRAIVPLMEGNHRIDGPPGSGKTYVLQEHLRYLIEGKLVPPDRILVVTHHKSAASRIRSRSEVLQKKRKNIQAVTLNALGDGIFKQYYEKLVRPGNKPYYAQGKNLVLKNRWKSKDASSSVQYNLLAKAKVILSQDILVSWPVGLPIVDLPAIKSSDFIDDTQCLKFIEQLRHYGVFPFICDSTQDIQEAAASSKVYGKNISKYYTLYRAYLIAQADQGYYTYDDQILFALAILSAYPAIASRYQRKFEHIIVDEYQDLTRAQVRLLQILSQKYHHIMLFGDPLQNIRPDVIAERTFLWGEEQFLFDEKTSLFYEEQYHYLTTNFRCVQEILDLAHAVLGNSAPPFSQQAARGYLNDRPEIISVEKLVLSSPSKYSDNELLLKAMVDAALDRMSTLSADDLETVGFIVAKAELDRPNSTIRKYLENDKKEYLQSKHIGLLLLSNRYDYRLRHMQRMLTYFRLICHGAQEQDCEYLLQHCLTRPFSWHEVQTLKALAQNKDVTLYTLLKDDVLRDYCDLDQMNTLREHLSLLDHFGPDDNSSALWNAIYALPDGPLEFLERQQREGEEIQDASTIPDELKEKTVQELLDYTSSHISFLPEAVSHHLVLTTIDHAKSQEFSTVFLLGADQLKDRSRWYVAVTRARNRFFCLVDKNANLNHPILSAIRPYCAKRNWPEHQDKPHILEEYTQF